MHGRAGSGQPLAGFYFRETRHLHRLRLLVNGDEPVCASSAGVETAGLQLARALCDLARLWPGGRVPECVGGYAREDRAHPGAYPRANSFQSWNQSVFPILLQSLLGARPVGALGLLPLDPVLPSWLPELTVRGWRVGRARVSLRFRRGEDGRTRYRVLETEGRLRIVRQRPVDALGVGLPRRLGDLVRGLLPS